MRAPWLAGALLLAAPAAYAQSLGLQTTCTGTSAPVVTFGMVIDNGVDPITNIGSAAAGSVIDEAECLCNSQDLFLQGLVTTPLPQGFLPAFSVWEGAGCNAVTARSVTANTCEQISADVGPMNFWAGSQSTQPSQMIAVRALISPIGASSPTNPEVHTCPEGGTNISNSVWFLFGDPNNPDYCATVVPANTIPPTPPVNVTAGSGDETVTVTWNPPPTGTSVAPISYQVLCADANGNPLPGQGAFDMSQSIKGNVGNQHILAYSTCTAAGIQRRVLPTGSPVVPVDTDGGVPVIAGGTVDNGTIGAATLGIHAETLKTEADPTTPTNVTPTASVGPFISLDKSYVCSDQIQNALTTFSFRISGLTNGSLYQFVVVGIDGSGNTGPSPVVTATPHPSEDLYQRFIDEGGQPQGFCFIATAAYGSYQNPAVKILRRFRDQALLPNRRGREFVSWYYRTSPPYARFIAVHPVARFLVRMALWPVIGAAAFWLWLAWWEQLVVVAAGTMLVRSIRRERNAS